MRGMRRAGALVLVAWLLVACGRGGEAAPGDTARNGARDGGAPASRITPVETAAAQLGSIARSIVVSGVVEPIRTVGVNSQVGGAVLAVQVEEGDAVRPGTVLARLDDRELRAQLASAEASFQVAEASYERAARLRDRNVITLPEYERERTAYAAAKAQLDQLRTRLSYSTVSAPIAGIVTEKRVERGDVVGPQARLFALADVSTLVVRAGVSELDVVQLEVGSPAQASLDAYPGRAFSGRIRRIFPAADPGTRLVPVEVALTDPAARSLRPGFLARVTFALGEREDVLLVPSSAIIGATGSEAIFVIENGRAARRSVSTGVTSQGRVEVVAGLAAGDIVVTAGNSTLRDGAEVRVVSGPGATPARTAEDGSGT